MADDKNSEETLSNSVVSTAIKPASSPDAKGAAPQADTEMSEEERQHLEEAQKKEAAHQAELVRLAAEEARKARLDAEWRDMEEKRFEYDRIAHEKIAHDKAENMRFIRNAILVIVGIVLAWQLWVFVAPPPPPPAPNVPDASQPPPAANQAAPAPDPRGATEMEEGMKLFDGNDFAKAAEYFKKAAEQGNTKAQSNMGSMYAEGKGVIQDYQQALSWHLKAAEQGSGESQSGLGAMYAEGKGVPKDYVEADKWFQIAGKVGGEEENKRRESVEQAMTPEQRAEAAQRAEEWAKAHSGK